MFKEANGAHKRNHFVNSKLRMEFKELVKNINES